MIDHPAVMDILGSFQQIQDRRESHRKIEYLIGELCQDRVFLFDVIRHCLSDPKFLNKADCLTFPIFQLGDIGLAINLFVPIRDGAKDITQDNIHHHGWRLLSTGVVSGDGYNYIKFRHRCHENRAGNVVNLEIDEISRHTKGKVRFIDSHTAHVVFHPTSLSSTLAVYSADRILTNQKIKRHLAAFRTLSRMAVRMAHATGLNELLGLNQIKGLYFHPEGGWILETQNYNKPFDGNREEILGCMFRFLQQVEFNDVDFLNRIAKDAPPEATRLINKLIAGEPIPDIGIWGNLRRRFSKTQILQALDHSVPRED